MMSGSSPVRSNSMQNRIWFALFAAFFLVGLLNVSSTQAQDGRWGPDSATAVRKYSLYQEYYKQKEYESAYKPWSWVFRNAPKVSQNLYIDGAKLLKTQIKQAQGAQEEAYIDTLELLFDQRIKYFAENDQDRGLLLGRKGVALYQADPGEYEKVNELLRKSLELTGKQTIISVPYVYAITNRSLMKTEKISKEELITRYDRVSQIMTYQAENSRSGATWKKYQGKIDDLMAPYLSCEDLESVYKPKMESDDLDLEGMKDVQQKLEASGCTQTGFYFSLSEKVFDQDPSADGAAALGKGYLGQDKYQEASRFLKEAIELEDMDAQKAEYYLSLAQAYKELGQFKAARSAAYSAANLKSGWGEPYLFLGDLYVAGAQRCGSEAFEHATVYWAAVDKYNQAKANDPALASDANKRINTYKKYYPGKEAAFFKGLKEGQEYTIDCWVNETTTVRVSETG